MSITFAVKAESASAQRCAEIFVTTAKKIPLASDKRYPDVYIEGFAVLAVEQRRLRWKDYPGVDLTPSETKILSQIFNAPNYVMKVEALTDIVWDGKYSDGSYNDKIRVLSGILTPLRKKIRDIDPEFDGLFIENGRLKWQRPTTAKSVEIPKIEIPKIESSVTIDRDAWDRAGIKIDEKSLLLTWLDFTPVPIRKKQIQFLNILVSQARSPINKRELYAQMWTDAYDRNLVSKYIKQIENLFLSVDPQFAGIKVESGSVMWTGKRSPSADDIEIINGMAFNKDNYQLTLPSGAVVQLTQKNMQYVMILADTLDTKITVNAFFEFMHEGSAKDLLDYSKEEKYSYLLLYATNVNRKIQEVEPGFPLIRVNTRVVEWDLESTVRD